MLFTPADIKELYLALKCMQMHYSRAARTRNASDREGALEFLSFSSVPCALSRTGAWEFLKFQGRLNRFPWFGARLTAERGREGATPVP